MGEEIRDIVRIINFSCDSQMISLGKSDKVSSV